MAKIQRLALRATLLFFISSLTAIEYLRIDEARSLAGLLTKITASPKSQKAFGLSIQFNERVSSSERTSILDDLFRTLAQQYPAIAKNIERLDLSDNQLANSPIFKGLEHLKYLNLSSNQLQIPPEVAHLSELEELVLSENRLKQQPILAGLNNLKSLLLDENKLQSAHFITSLPKLETLSLAYNKFEYAPNIDGLTQLKHLIFYGNPLSHPITIPLILRDQLRAEGIPAKFIQYGAGEQSRATEPSKLPELERLVQHMLVMQELKSLKKEATHSSGCFALRLPVEKPTTPTDAWFNYFNIQFPLSTKPSAAQPNQWITEEANDYIGALQKKPEFKRVFTQAIQRERILAESYFPFYHANDPGSEVYLDAIEYAVSLTYILKNSPAGGLKLRIPHGLHQADVPLTQWYQNNFVLVRGKDDLPHLQESLLSMNVSLFGNTGTPNSGSWDLFVRSLSLWPKTNRDIAIKIAALFGLDRNDRLCHTLEEKMNGYAKLLGSIHSLHQIFIAKDRVNEHVVLTATYGKPRFESDLMPEVSNKTKLPDVRAILQRYIDNFGSLINADRIEARIRFTPELILNDTDDIIHYTYHVPENIFEQPEIAKARAEVHQVIKDMLIKSLDNPANGPLTTAKRLRQLIEQADAAMNKQKDL